ncbi:hypothetical protein [Acinetobacter phage vB_AbaM_fThrA]|nr:hypothetical protein [Acinetobacter phage vB_AbaM_fThrA]
MIKPEVYMLLIVYAVICIFFGYCLGVVSK